MADASLTIIDSVLHVAGTPNPGDGLALAVGIASVDALFEGAADGTDVSTGVVVTALNGEVAAGLGVILVVEAGQSLRILRGRDSGGSSSPGALSGPDTTVVAQTAESVLEVAPSVVEPARTVSRCRLVSN